MANPYNGYQNSNNNNLVQIKDYAHAARTFVDDSFRLLPKQNYLFHVVFNINTAALNDPTLTQKNRNEISMLVKSAALPTFTIKTETVNQYNRKKIVQLTHEYGPIAIKFRDDNANLVNSLWKAYYTYFFADPTSANSTGAYARNAYKPKPSNSYGLDNKSQTQFFNHITIYQLHNHRYTSYKLINPIIQSWAHEGMDYTQVQAHENTMTIGYEAVAYDSGVIDDQTPEGFGTAHYDTTPSPLTSAGGFEPLNTSLYKDSSNPARRPRAVSDLAAITKTINTYQNSQQKLPSAAQAGIVSSKTITATQSQGVSGLQGTAFPRAKTTSTTTVAKSISITKSITVTRTTG
jgi:hypothetical protein